PKGLAAAVLASLVAQRGIPGGETIQAAVFAVVIFSITLTAVLVPLASRAPLARYYRKLFANFQD
ncbi:MAG TPA: hypothetical protein VFV50_11835, partial [Bdellovibrionales bacterium]|nr:hypothetical protein [Bdellovibrionales bacterium]